MYTPGYRTAATTCLRDVAGMLSTGPARIMITGNETGRLPLPRDLAQHTAQLSGVVQARSPELGMGSILVN